LKTFKIRKIQPKDNKQLKENIQSILIEFGVPKIGTAYEDKSLGTMFENYQEERSVYFVIEKNEKVVGGGGIKHLDSSEENICELQKMYFLPETRGFGLGQQMIDLCLKTAKELNYDKCYLETMPYMKAARHLYKKNGFTPLDKPVGNTGHYSCNVWMIKELKQ